MKTTEEKRNITDYNSTFSFDTYVIYLSQTAEVIYSSLLPLWAPPKQFIILAPSNCSLEVCCAFYMLICPIHGHSEHNKSSCLLPACIIDIAA